jgi:regulator of protease activity HflC (stomatin/prohibitin superfamily)
MWDAEEMWDAIIGGKKKKIAAISVGAVALLAVANSITIVQPRQRAIPVTLGHKGKVLREGPHFVWPITDVNKFDLTLNISENKGVILKTKDSQTVHFDVIGHYCLTAGCLDPEKAENVPDTDIDKQYYTFRSTDYHNVYTSFLLEAATDAVGKRAITDIAANISAIADDIKTAVIKKLTEAGYSSLHTQDVLLRNYLMDPPAEAFANNVANDMQRAKQLLIQSTNLDQEKLNATKRGQVMANELAAAAGGISEATNKIASEGHMSTTQAGELVRVQMLTAKWNGNTLTAPVVFPGVSQPASVLVSDAAARPLQPPPAAPAPAPAQ